MARFYEFQVPLVHKQNEEMGKDIHPEIYAKVFVDLDTVVAFREAEDEGVKMGQATLIYLSSGETFWITKPYEEFKKIMGIYWQQNEK